MSAITAGRQPSEISRAVNILADVAEPEILADLATRIGFDTFILASDSPWQLEDFGRRVGPSTRQLVSQINTAEEGTG